MEEKKTNSENKQQKLTYEQLNEVCAQLYQQNQNYIKQLQQTNNALMSKRLDYMFKVVENSNLFNSEFVQTCIQEIEDSLAIDNGEAPEEK